MKVPMNEFLFIVISLFCVVAHQECYKKEDGEEICENKSNTYDPEVFVHCICFMLQINISNDLGNIE